MSFWKRLGGSVRFGPAVGARARQGGARGRRAARPGVEVLEGRTLLSTALPGPAPFVTRFSTGDVITTGPDGNLWFTEEFPAIGRCTPAGQVTEFPVTGVGLPWSSGVTAGPDGNIWFTMTSPSSPEVVCRITPAGQITEFPVTSLTSDAHSGGITAGPDGDLWFTAANGIGRITPAGKITTFQTGLAAGSSPSKITAGADGNLWFTDVPLTGTGRIGRITPAGAITEFSLPIENQSAPRGITAGPDGNVWFTAGDAIGRIAPGGAVKTFPLNFQHTFANGGITAGPDGHLYFASVVNNDLSSVNNRIDRITPAGVVGVFGEGTDAPGAAVGLSAGPDAKLWFIDMGSNSIYTLSLPSRATPTLLVTDAGGTYNGSAFPARATINGKSSLEGVAPTLTYYAGTYASAATLQAAVTAVTAHALAGAPANAGSYTVLASFAGSADYQSARAVTTFTIHQVTPAVTVADKGGAANGKPYAATGAVTGIHGASLGTPAFTYYRGPAATGMPLPGAPVAAGTYTVLASYAGSANYAAAHATATFTLTGAEGGLVPLFAGGPVLTESFTAPTAPTASVANGAVVQPDGKVVAVGTVNVGQGSGFTVFRYNTDGSPDTNFGPNHNGQTVPPLAQPAVATAVALEGDGKILVAGYTSNPDQGGFVLARYDKDGSLDTAFGTGGVVTTSFGDQNGPLDVATSIVIDGAGRIVLGGYTGHWVINESVGQLGGGDFALARYTATGSLDLTFGTGGRVVTNFAGSNDSGIGALALDAQGRIVAAGYALVTYGGGAPVTNFALARYSTNGSLDKSFGSGGEVATSFGGYDGDFANGLVIQPGGDIVAAGQARNNHQTDKVDFALARCTATGSLDPTFGTGGKVTTDFQGNGDSGINAVTLDGQGIVVAGYTASSASQYPIMAFAVARYTSAGALDKTFGTGGAVATGFQGTSVSAQGIARGPNGQLLVIGGGFVLVRYNANGSPDTSFGSGGQVSTPFTGPVGSLFAGAAAQPDGQILVVGTPFGTPYSLGILRLNLDGSRDTTFGMGGEVLLTQRVGHTSQVKVAVQPNDKILLVGGGTSVSLLRLNYDGTVDTSFGKAGLATLANLPGVPLGSMGRIQLVGVVVQSDGKIVVGADAGSPGPNAANFDLIRFNKDGSLDTGYGAGHTGLVTTAFSRTTADTLALAPDGEIVVTGLAGASLALARYSTDGSPDTSFGTGGVVTTSLQGVVASALVFQPHGKIVVGGSAGGQGHFFVARLNPDGSPDKTFGTGGQTLTNLGGIDTAVGLGLDGYGRIMLAGYRDSGTLPGTNIMDVVRYTSNGHVDTGFGTGGMASTSFADAGASLGGRMDLVLEPSGTLVVAGPSSHTPNTNAIGLAEYAFGS